MVQNLIAVECAANSSSVALLQASDLEKKKQMFFREVSGSQHHAEQLLPLLDEIILESGLKKSQITAVAFNQGPGAFTGLRIACGMAQGLALGLNIPVVQINSLRATAELSLMRLGDGELLLVLLDARMGEAFMAVYEKISSSVLRLVQAPCLIAVAQVYAWLFAQSWSKGKVIHCCGNALIEYADVLTKNDQVLYQDMAWPDARVIATLAWQQLKYGGTVPASLAAPVYIRDKVAFTQSERATGLGGNPKADVPILKTVNKLQLPDLPLGFKMRAMTLNDLNAVLEIEKSVQDYPWSYGNFEDSLKSKYPAWVIEPTATAAASQSSTIVAFAVQMLAPDVAHLLLIGVSRDFQRQGLGKALLSVMEHNALAHDLQVQILEVSQSNYKARQFYEKNGYWQIGLRKGYYYGVSGQSEDALVMQKQLGNEHA